MSTPLAPRIMVTTPWAEDGVTRRIMGKRVVGCILVVLAEG
jgi:hypothetical protein